ncbi:unnamed protein product [Acanthoscelides obtectus]|uniref:Uncharacterized protein n=1 Tax=Acanthoscelides obtectus TaxID=200917 RepID=A0A9P0LW68_ACAOB|nr:unnamed protein product [Acanthoscelides obtectus]CAK1678111.1 hypothetical protein AOBTE_LOCUS31758 [Acanthoscelides obtectus]
MSNPNPTCSFDASRLETSAVKCVVSPTPFNCIVKPLVTAGTDPCFQQHMMTQELNDPYFQHMPKTSAAEATIYAARMGGQHHEMMAGTPLLTRIDWSRWKIAIKETPNFKNVEKD